MKYTSGYVFRTDRGLEVDGLSIPKGTLAQVVEVDRDDSPFEYKVYFYGFGNPEVDWHRFSGKEIFEVHDSMTKRLLSEINKVWSAQGENELAYVSAVKVCGKLYDLIASEGLLKEMEFDPNTYKPVGGECFTIPIVRGDDISGLVEYVYE